MGNPIGRCRMTRANQKGAKANSQMLNDTNAKFASIHQQQQLSNKSRSELRKDIDNNINRIFNKKSSEGRDWVIDKDTGKTFNKDWVTNGVAPGMEPTVDDTASWGDERGLNSKQRYQLKRQAKFEKNKMIKQRYRGGQSDDNRRGGYIGWKKSYQQAQERADKIEQGYYHPSQNHRKGRDNEKIY